MNQASIVFDPMDPALFKKILSPITQTAQFLIFSHKARHRVEETQNVASARGDQHQSHGVK